ncbi:hypothetical protein [Desulfofustis limnaeus]|uniref:Hemolytic protein HlpA n=1 Tax=Desulfofustis limnaeus TaxID=2740163 RepID=A0ABN6M1W2_9BACT|nr:hypothetical protein [Desulfofustis limnaeus]BDD86888.1 hemolytic protein HlpA [Desulfofustis limnaeus]
MLQSMKPIQPVPLKTAVLFMVYKRPDTTKQVFEAIRQARPPLLYVAADGHRFDHEGEAEKVAKVREIATAVDWPCEVKTLFRDKNLGCKSAVSEAITWFFDIEEQGIILEDDCLPNPDFFTFCENLLEKYAEDERILVITGNNFQNGQKRGDASYYFSKYNHCWGWASWRRAWQHYQGDLPFWPEWKHSGNWVDIAQDSVERRYWENIFKMVQEKKIDSWGFPWTASVWYSRGLTATPNVNLVSNIGFGSDSTHTTVADSPLSALKTGPLGELTHPVIIEQNVAADRYVFEYHFGGQHLRFPRSLLRMIRRVLRSLIHRI